MRLLPPLRLSIRAKVLMLALGLALTPLLIVSLLGLSSLNTARNTAMQVSTDALRTQAEANLAKRAADKARIYDLSMEDIERQVQAVSTTITSLMQAGPAAASGASGVWVSPNGPTPANLQAYAPTVARARQAIPVLAAAAQSNALISLAYVGLEDGGVVAFDHDITEVLQKEQLFDARQRPWYIAARTAGHTVWADTYIDANTKKLVTTCAVPFYDQRGQFVGVVGFDLLLDRIQQDLLKLDVGQAGYAFLINNSGKMLIRPNMSTNGRRWTEPFASENLLETRDPQLRATFERMTRQQQGIEQIVYGGENVYLAYAPIAHAGWSVGIVIPEAEIIRPAEAIGAVISAGQQQLWQQIALVLAISVVVVTTLGAIFAVLLTRPLRQLQVGAQRIAAGDLHHRMYQVNNDEIGDVIRSFNMMANALNQKMAELEDNLRQLSTLNAVSNRFKTILSLPVLFEAIPRAVRESFGFERVVLYVLQEGVLRAVGASFGPNTGAEEAAMMAAANAHPITLDSETVEADIMRSGQAVIVDNPWQHPRVLQTKQQVSRSESYVQVPIFGRDEKIIGLLSADYAYSRRAVNARDAAQLLTYASMVGLAIENTRLYSELERQVVQRTSELRVALNQAQEADRLKGQFLAAISHELRTPLNSIIGFSTVMLDELDGPISAMQREDLKTINQNGRFLLHLINELLDLERIDSGKLDLDLQPLDLHTLIGEVTDTVAGLLHRKPLDLRTTLAAGLPQAHADYGKTRQILLNLLSNAVKFTDKGTITVAAQCVIMAHEALAERAVGASPTELAEPDALQSMLTRDGRQVTPFLAISVRDTGIGIAHEHLPLLFEEFRQIPSRHAEKQGSGLGLAICRRLIEAHGGRIWVESTPGQGSTFTFTLPCAIAPHDLVAAQPVDVDAVTR